MIREKKRHYACILIFFFRKHTPFKHEKQKKKTKPKPTTEEIALKLQTKLIILRVQIA